MSFLTRLLVLILGVSKSAMFFLHNINECVHTRGLYLKYGNDNLRTTTISSLEIVGDGSIGRWWIRHNI